jgi:hypothetical protein
MNDWYQRMVAALQLNGKGEPTQKAYTRAVRMLSEFYGKPPDLISEPELQDYFLHRKNINCVFRTKSATHSDAKRPPIPEETGHRFGAIRPPVYGGVSQSN